MGSACVRGDAATWKGRRVNDTWRFVVFLTVVLSLWTLMHVYAVWRAWQLPGLCSPAAHRAVVLACAVLWACYPLGRMASRGSLSWLSYPLELMGAVWMGVLLLAVVWLLAADVVTGFGFFMPLAAPKVRLAALGVAGLLAVVAAVQAQRPPAVREIEVSLAGLPMNLDGKVAVQLSDMHLGTLLAHRWLHRLRERVDGLRPDILLVTGDLVDGDASKVERFLPELKRFGAPLGVYAVTGNHEFYAGLDKCVALFEAAGYTVLRDRWVEAAPGLVLAGVDDLTARRQFQMDGDPVARALAHRPPGATLFLCHSPLKVEEAASLGAGLMLSGHTHDGQIWPFGYVVRLTYPYLAGRYAVGEMTLLVSRGTGFWGPPMRLWHRSEILRITLRSPGGGSP